jgi:hypothetical protein
VNKPSYSKIFKIKKDQKFIAKLFREKKKKFLPIIFKIGDLHLSNCQRIEVEANQSSLKTVQDQS